MRHDHRPLWLKKAHRSLEARYLRWRLEPAFDLLGPHAQVMQPWTVRISGEQIRAGRSLHVISGRDRPVALTTWTIEREDGRRGGSIDLGDYVLLCPGSRIDSGTSIKVGDNCMLAAGAYITDADWHGLYDRTEVIGNAEPVVLGNNVWIGDSATVCKGVRIGDNSIVGAGAVVTRDVEANVIVAGNPARVVKELDPNEPRRLRSDLLADNNALMQWTDDVERLQLAGNTLTGWLRTLLWPRRGD